MTKFWKKCCKNNLDKKDVKKRFLIKKNWKNFNNNLEKTEKNLRTPNSGAKYFFFGFDCATQNKAMNIIKLV